MILDSTSVVVPADVCARLMWLVDLANRVAARDALPLQSDVKAFLGEIEIVGRAFRSEAAERIAHAGPRMSAHALSTHFDTVGSMSINDVAKALGCKPRNALDLVKRHGLGRKVGGRWRVDAVDFDEFDRTRKEQT